MLSFSTGQFIVLMTAIVVPQLVQTGGFMWLVTHPHDAHRPLWIFPETWHVVTAALACLHLTTLVVVTCIITQARRQTARAHLESGGVCSLVTHSTDEWPDDPPLRSPSATPPTSARRADSLSSLLPSTPRTSTPRRPLVLPEGLITTGARGPSPRVSQDVTPTIRQSRGRSF